MERLAGVNRIVDNKDFQIFPHYLKSLKICVKKTTLSTDNETPKLVVIDFYQTTKYNTYPHYKPLSKIIPKTTGK